MFLSFLSTLKDAIVIYKDTKSYDCSDQDGKEREPRHACIHLVYTLEYERVSFEKEVEDRIGNGKVDAGKEDYSFEGYHMQGTHQGDADHLLGPFFCPLNGRENVGITGFFAHASGP